MHRRCTGHAGAGYGDRLHRDGRLGDAEARTAECLRHCDAEPAVACECLEKRVGEAAIAIAGEPIVVAQRPGRIEQGQDRLADRLLLGCELEVHASSAVMVTPSATMRAISASE